MWHSDNGGAYPLHVLDLATGQPVRPAVAFGHFVLDAHGHPVTFDPVFQKQRPGLLLLLKPADLEPAHHGDVDTEGTIYIAFGASIESSPTYHGWVFAYTATSNFKAVWCATPNGSRAGVWQGGDGLTARRCTSHRSVAFTAGVRTTY